MACGILGWSPAHFWDSSLIELLEARRAWVLANSSGEEAKRLRYEDFKSEMEEAGYGT